MIKVYCYSRCSTCKKAQKFLDDKEIPIKANQKRIVLDNFEDVKDNHQIKVTFLPYNPPTYSNTIKILIIALITFVISIGLIRVKKKI